MILSYSNIFTSFSYSQTPINEESFYNMSNNEGDSVYPQISSSPDNVYVVWQDNVFGEKKRNYDILLKTGTNGGGQTFGDVTNLSNNSGFSEPPQIAVNGDNVYVVWADNPTFNREILYMKSTDGGQTFGNVTNLSNNTQDSFNQEIAVDGDNVYVMARP